MPKSNRHSDRELTDLLGKVAALLNTSPATVLQLVERGSFPPPEERMISIHQIAAWFGVSKNTIYQWIREGKFPKPVCLGNEGDPFGTRRWYFNEVREWLHGRPRGVGGKSARKERAKE